MNSTGDNTTGTGERLQPRACSQQRMVGPLRGAALAHDAGWLGLPGRRDARSIAERSCPRCKETKPLDQFRATQRACKPCLSAAQKVARSKGSFVAKRNDYQRAYMAKYRSANPERELESVLRGAMSGDRLMMNSPRFLCIEILWEDLHPQAVGNPFEDLCAKEEREWDERFWHYLRWKMRKEESFALAQRLDRTTAIVPTRKMVAGALVAAAAGARAGRKSSSGAHRPNDLKLSDCGGAAHRLRQGGWGRRRREQPV
jgi:hypothetical protein